MQKFLLILSLIIIYLIGRLSFAEAIIDSSDTYWIDNVNIVDVVEERIRYNKSLLINNGHIQQIVDVDSVVGSDAIRRVDGENGFITPGLVDMHVHMFEKGAFALSLSHGVTHVRIMNGVSAQLKWRDAVAKGELVGSSASVSSPIVSGYLDAFFHHGIDTEHQARDAAKRFKQEGYDLIKAYGNLSEPVFKALIDESRNVGIPVAKHAPHVPGTLTIQDFADLQSFEHVEDIYQGPLDYEMDTDKLPAVIKALKSANVTITPTLNIYDQLTQLSVQKEDYLQRLPVEYTSTLIAMDDQKNQVQRWLGASEKMANHNQQVLAFLLKITYELDKAGVPLLVGSDSGVLLSPHGLATHNEISLFRQAGIKPYRILRAATLNPAKALGLDTEIGQVKALYNADFILTQRNPIDDLSVLKHPEAVVKAGHWYGKDSLIQMRETAIETRNLWSEVSIFAEMMTR